MDPVVRSLLAKRIQVMIEPWPRESREYPESLRTVSNHFSELIDRVEHRHERVIVTRNLRAAAVVISPEDLAQLEETIDVLSDPAALEDIRETDDTYARGDVVRGSTASGASDRDRARPW